MRSQSTLSVAPPDVRSLSSGRIGVAIVVACVATRLPST